MTPLIALQSLGCLLAWLGSWLCGSQAPIIRRRGFTLYLAANAILVVWAAFDFAHAWPSMLMYLAFIAPAVRGIRNNAGTAASPPATPPAQPRHATG